MPGDTIILHMCTNNYDQMIYGSRDIVRNRWTDRQIEKVIYRFDKSDFIGGCPT